MQENESRERFIEGLKLAASRAREMATATSNYQWNNIAASIDGIRKKGEMMIFGYALNRAEVINEVNLHQERLKRLNG